MKDEIKIYATIFGYLFAIGLTIWTIIWGIPLIATGLQNPWWKLTIILFILPLLPMLPGLFTGSYKLLDIPKVYVYEFLDMYYAVFVIILYLPLVAAQVLTITLIIVFISVTLIIIILLLNLAFTGQGTSGLRKDDFLFYITVFQFNIIALIVIRYIVMYFEKLGDYVEEETSSKLDLLIKLLQKRKNKTRTIGRK